MSTPLEWLPEVISFKAAEDVVGSRFVVQSAADEVEQADAITDRAVGVAREDASTGETLGVVVGGFIGVEAAAAIALGANIAPSANGRAQTAVATQFVHGIAREAATAAGDIILVQIVPPTGAALA